MFKAVLSLLLCASVLFAGNLYVDSVLTTDITDGTYSIAQRSTGGSDGNAYHSVKAAVAAMSVGDTVTLRGGTYREGPIILPRDLNGDSWMPGHFNMIRSYPGEWAILDGENSADTVLGSTRYTCVIGDPRSTYSIPLKYWKFERLEIKNGASADGEYANGFYGGGGPFIFRYCYIHDNLTTARIGSFNPGGLRGGWAGTLVEYCFFERNGAEVANLNCAHINCFSDYIWSTTRVEGFTLRGDDKHNMNNIYRYNYFGEGSIAIKDKGDQLFTGRNPDGGAGLDDQYKTYGNRIHHNFFTGLIHSAINGHQDFAQVYNNIFDNCHSGISYNADETPLYKVTIYNNLLKNVDHEVIFLHHKYAPGVTGSQDSCFYGYIFNNILDSCCYTNTWNKEEVAVYNPPDSSLNYDSAIISHNYSYNTAPHFKDPDGDYVVFLGDEYPGSRYTQSVYETAFSGKVSYYQPVVTPLYKDTAGSGQYKTLGTHMVRESKTVASGGYGNAHPYLQEMIPSYIGATDPSDDDWVDTVLSLVDMMYDTIVPPPDTGCPTDTVVVIDTVVLFDTVVVNDTLMDTLFIRDTTKIADMTVDFLIEGNRGSAKISVQVLDTVGQ